MSSLYNYFPPGAAYSRHSLRHQNGDLKPVHTLTSVTRGENSSPDSKSQSCFGEVRTQCGSVWRQKGGR